MDFEEFTREHNIAIEQHEYLMSCFNRLPYLEDYQLIQAEVLLQNASAFDDLFTIVNRLDATRTQEEFDKVYSNYLDKKSMLAFHYNNAKIFFDGLQTSHEYRY
jgi:hypothetical protein